MYSTTASRPRTTLVRGAVAALAAAVVAVAVDAVIAAIGHAAGVSDDFKPMEFPSYASLTVIGVVVAAIAWTVIRAKSARPHSVLRRLVPAVVALSLVPDLIVGFARSQAHTTWGGVAALMCMHLAVAAVAVAAFARALPVHDTEAPAAN